MVHQHFMLVPVMTVTENVMLGNEPTRSGLFLDKATVAERIREISETIRAGSGSGFLHPGSFSGDTAAS